MTGAVPPSFFSSRVVALGWQELARLSPERIWLGAIPCHNIEALVEILSSQPVDALQNLLLNGLASLEAAPLDRPLLRACLRELVQFGLVDRAGPGWALTAAGRQAVDTGQITLRRRKRRGFCFVDNSSWQRPPHFLPLTANLAERIMAPADWQFRPGWLKQALEQSPAWKRRYGFPEDVAALIESQKEPGDWGSVMIDFPGRVYLLLVQVAPAQRPALQGYALRPGSWLLRSTEPVLSLEEGWQEVFPELCTETALEAWREHWLRWCRPHGIPAGEAEACQVRRVGHRVIIEAPARLAARYRTGARAEALSQEGWLLIGEGRSREAGQIEMVEAE